MENWFSLDLEFSNFNILYFFRNTFFSFYIYLKLLLPVIKPNNTSDIIYCTYIFERLPRIYVLEKIEAKCGEEKDIKKNLKIYLFLMIVNFKSW